MRIFLMPVQSIFWITAAIMISPLNIPALPANAQAASKSVLAAAFPEESIESAAYSDEARAAYENFFNQSVTVRSVTITDGHMLLDLCEGILSYGGGNANELELISCLIKIAASIPGVEQFSLTVNGRLRPLAEGRIIFSEPVGNAQPLLPAPQ